MAGSTISNVVTNTITITSSGTGAGSGVYNSPLTITNTGTVEGAVVNRLTTSPTIVLGGTITGDIDINQASSANITLLPGGSFGGVKSATLGLPNPEGPFTVDLGVGTAPGTIGPLMRAFNDYGSAVRQFETFTVDPGAYWTLTGYQDFSHAKSKVPGLLNSHDAYPSLIDAGNLTNAGTLNLGVRLQQGAVFNNTGTLSDYGHRLPIATSDYFDYSTVGIDATVTNSGIIKDIWRYSSAIDITGRGYVANSGTIIATYFEGGLNLDVVGSGIRLGNGGLVNNTGTIAGDVDIYRWFLGNGGTVINKGTITGQVYLAGGSVNNSGVIDLTTLPEDEDLWVGGVLIGGTAGITGTVTNSGTVIGDRFGITTEYPTGTVATVVNSGTIIAVGTPLAPGHNDPANAFAGVGVALAGGTVVDSGSISGAAGAIVFGTIGDANRVVLSPGYTPLATGHYVYNSGWIGGSVIGSTAAGATNTLELAASGTAGTVSGLSDKFVNFGTVTVDSGAQWAVTGGDNVIGSGQTLTVYGTLTDFGSVTNQGSISGTGRLLVDPATFVNSGSVGIEVTLDGGSYLGNSATISVAGTAVYGTNGANTVVNSGTITGTGTAGVGINLATGGTVIDSGQIGGSSGTAIVFGGSGANLLALEDGYSITGSIAGSPTAGATNTLELLGTAGAVSVDFNSLGLGNFGTVAFGTASGNSETLKITDTTALPGTIASFDTAYKDIIDLTQLNPDGLQTPTLNDSDQLIVTNGSQTVSLQLDSENYSGLVWQAVADPNGGTFIEEDNTACYCRGTLILTDCGEVPVEALAIGDCVATLSGEAKPIKWIGRRHYAGRFIAGNRDALPIRIAAGAFADGVPARDLWVSPEHALYLDDVLIPARCLVNGLTVTQVEEIGHVEYFHIELDAHDVIFAEGAPAETFVDDDSRLMFHNAAEFFARYPEALRLPARYYAPRVEEGLALDVLRRKLLVRARRLGVDGREMPAKSLCGHVDVVTRDRIAGWAFDPASPATPVAVVVLANGVEIARVVADRYRKDLAAAGFGDGCHSFDLMMPSGLARDTQHQIEIGFEFDWSALPGSPVILEPVTNAVAA